MFQTLRRTVENIKDPLYRYFEREVNSGSRLLRDVIHDLEDVVAICQVLYIAQPNCIFKFLLLS